MTSVLNTSKIYVYIYKATAPIVRTLSCLPNVCVRQDGCACPHNSDLAAFQLLIKQKAVYISIQ